MNLKKFLIKLIEFYQYFISPLFGSKCRYYPTCSEYTKIEFETDTLFRAFIKSSKRILTCNQLFKGGIDYPIVYKKIKKPLYEKREVKYWLIPKGKNKYIVIKADNGK